MSKVNTQTKTKEFLNKLSQDDKELLYSIFKVPLLRLQFKNKVKAIKRNQ